MEFIVNSTFWIALGSIATAVLAFLTYRSLQQYKNQEGEIHNREIVERILNPLLQDLANIAESSLPNLLLLKNDSWEKIKRDNPFLIFKLSKNLRDRIASLYYQINSAADIQDKNIRQLYAFIRNRVFDELENKPTSFDTSYIRMCAFKWDMKGQTFWFNFQKAIFFNTTLQEDIKRSQTIYPSAPVENASFILQGAYTGKITPDIFDKILANIKADIAANRDLTEYIKGLHDIGQEIQTLDKELEQLQEQFSL